MVDGINSVLVQGELVWPELKYTEKGTALLKAKVRIPSVDQRTGELQNSYLKLTAWDEFAEYLGSLPPKSNIRASARIQERSFTNREGQRQWVTDLVVDGVEAVTSEEGNNQFLLQGELKWPEFKYVGQNKDVPLFRGKVRAPFVRADGSEGNAYVRIIAWQELAEALGKLPEGTFVKASGHIQERTWQDKANNKRVFTDAVVTNFTVAGAETNG